MSQMNIPVGSRKSQLALVQTNWVIGELKALYPGLEAPIITQETVGDQIQSEALYKINDKALWTTELEQMLRTNSARFLVHSLKDIPTELPEDMCIAAITKRQDPRDVAIFSNKHKGKYSKLSDLPKGSCIGTSSLRRIAQLKLKYPHFNFKTIRGNIRTRLKHLDDEALEFDCIILAAAGIIRLDLQERINEWLGHPDMYYAIGQGALGIECRSDDTEVIELISKLQHPQTFLECTAERALLSYLKGGCSVPIGVYSSWSLERKLTLMGVLNDVEGTKVYEARHTDEVSTKEEAESLGIEVAKQLLDQGISKILDKVYELRAPWK